MPSFLIEAIAFFIVILTVPIWVPVLMVVGVFMIISLLVQALIPVIECVWHKIKKALKMVILVAALVPAMANAETRDIAQTVLSEVNSQHKYVGYNADDKRPMAKYEVGNCARFAATYVEELRKRGVEASYLKSDMCKRGPHAFAVTHDGWVLDVLRNDVIQIKDYMNCE